ncbi:hypothetical protein D3C72_1810660 [compost metagenome]
MAVLAGYLASLRPGEPPLGRHRWLSLWMAVVSDMERDHFGGAQRLATPCREPQGGLSPKKLHSTEKGQLKDPVAGMPQGLKESLDARNGFYARRETAPWKVSQPL